MEDNIANNEQLRAYLLGELDELAEERLAEEIFVDPVRQAALLAERDDLLDEWISGGLDAVSVRKLEARLAQLPALREHADFARCLFQHFASVSHAQVAAAPSGL